MKQKRLLAVQHQFKTPLSRFFCSAFFSTTMQTWKSWDMFVQDFWETPQGAMCIGRTFWCNDFFFLFYGRSLPRDIIIQPHAFLISCFVGAKDFMKQITAEKLKSETRCEFLALELEPSEGTGIVASEEKLQGKVWQLFSNKTSGWKERARNKHFSTIGYGCLLSRYVAHIDNEQIAKLAGVSEAKFKILRKNPEVEWDFKPWRRSRILKLCKSGTESSNSSRKTKASSKSLQLFGHGISIMVFCWLMRYISDKASSSQESVSDNHGSVPTFAHLDAFVAIATFRFCKDRYDKVGNHR